MRPSQKSNEAVSFFEEIEAVIGILVLLLFFLPQGLDAVVLPIDFHACLPSVPDAWLNIVECIEKVFFGAQVELINNPCLLACGQWG